MAKIQEHSRIKTNAGMQDVITEIHGAVQSFADMANSDYSNYFQGNYIIAALCRDHEADPDRCSHILRDVYHYDITPEQVLSNFRMIRIANPVERENLFNWADSVAEFYAGAASGDKDAFSKLEELRKNVPVCHHSPVERAAAVMIYEKYPELDKYGDKKILFRLGNTMAKRFFYCMYDALCHVYDFPLFIPERRRPLQKVSPEQARIDYLESELKRTNEMFGELQEEFDDQLKESKTAELTDFFAHLNSDKYGNILDQLLRVRKGMDKLRKEGYELPIEINGLFNMVSRLIQFTRDSHIAPIMKINSQKVVSAEDIQFCDYEGSPFSSDSDRKVIEVV